MGRIYIVGLGPSDERYLTLAAIERINSSCKHIVRTDKHAAIKYFNDKNIEYLSLDYMYDELDDFDEVYERMACEVVKESECGDVNYYVPGSPIVAEKSVELIRQKHSDVQIISGMSFVEPICEALDIDMSKGFKVIDAMEFKSTDFSIHDSLVAMHVYNEHILDSLKLVVSEIYGDMHECALIADAGVADAQRIQRAPICELGVDFELNGQTSLYVPCVADGIYDYNDLVNIVERLRGDGGCPWDREQTHESMKHDLIEEAYELIETIDDSDYEHMIEELGDVLLQIVFHMSIGNEEGEFLPIEVTTGIVSKLIFRHPHVFGKINVADSNEVLYNWDKLKQEQRGLQSFTDSLRDIPKLPALMMAQKYSKRMMKLGFKWESVEGAIDKLDEELAEFKQARANGESLERISEELGDLLFSICNVGEYLGVDLEIILNKTLKKILKRFDNMESMANNRGIVLTESSLAVLDGLWEEAKQL